MHVCIIITFLFTCIQFENIFGMETKYERVDVIYYNRKYVEYLNITTGRTGRGQPYSVSMHGRSLYGFGDNITVDLALFERMSNGQYHPTPIQLTFKSCEFFEREPYIGKILKQLLNLNCPFPAGEYHFKNVWVDLSHFHYFLPFAWTHQVSTQARGDVNGYFGDTGEHLYNVSLYVTITQKPTLKKRS